jgi:hypothetical protein
LKDFMDWRLETETTDHGQTFKNQDTIVIAHNFKGYDGQFILNYLVHTALYQAFRHPQLDDNFMFRSVWHQIHRFLPFPALCPRQDAHRLWLDQTEKKDISRISSIRQRINIKWDPTRLLNITTLTTCLLPIEKRYTPGTPSNRAKLSISANNF